jgi:lipid-binding SYLF domain-containing protein
MAKVPCASRGHTVGYYSTATGSIGWQLGAQSRAIVFLFMTEESLNRFPSTDGWSAAGDASVAALKIGANGNLDTSTATGQVNAFVLTNHGLMAGLRSKSPKSRGSRRFENHTQGRGVMRGPS